MADYRRYRRQFGADLDLDAFYDLFWRRKNGDKAKIPKLLETAFLSPQSPREQEIKALIDEFARSDASRLEQDLFKQRKRLADAERSLAVKSTVAAAESRRIATGKVEWTLGKLADLRRAEPEERDARIFPGVFAPVIVLENGRHVIKPMRYQCRPAGKPSNVDRKFPGTYNARRDNLQGFWKDVFGFTHGLIVAEAFYENVPRHKVEGRELAEGETPQNTVLEFKPESGELLLVACLWSRWTSPDEPELLSFAAITDEPPAEVAAAGHDRCIIAIKPEHVDAWLSPDRGSLKAQHAILEDRAMLHYQHRLAA